MTKDLKGRVIRLVAAALCVSSQLSFGYDEIILEAVGQKAAKSLLDISGLLAGQSQAAVDFKAVLKSDLERSGWFKVTAGGPAAILLSGSCDASGSSLRVRCLAMQMPTQRNYLDKTFSGDAGRYRKLAHEVADEIVRAVKGCQGMASSRIVLIGTRTGYKELYVCDSDGYNLAQITDDKSISIAPRWYPDGTRLAYTSYRAGFPYIYSIGLGSSGHGRRQLTSFPGLNMCGSISSDGARMAMCLSRDGNPELYVMDLRDRRLTRITRTPNANEASPSWSPDGGQIVYVSDSLGPGRPQLYVAGSDGSAARRLSRSGSQNVAPCWGRNGLIAYTSLRDGQYQICVIDPKTGEDKQLTSDGAHYEDPGWAPDGRHIVCGRSVGHRSAVYVLDTMGDVPIRLLNVSGEWRSPAWSPR